MALTDNLEAFWNLEDLTDSSGNSHSLTNNASTTFTSGLIDNAATFARASSQALSIPFASLGGLVLTTPFTISLFYNRSIDLEMFQEACIFSIGKGTNEFAGEGGIRLFLSEFFGSTNLGLVVCGDAGPAPGGFNSVSPPSLSTWQHLALTVDGSNVLTCWIDGSLQAVNQYSGNFSSPANDLGIGGYMVSGSLSSHLDGQIDLFGVWNRALSEIEITELYNSGAGLDPTASPIPPTPSGIASFGSGGGFGSFSHGNGFN